MCSKTALSTWIFVLPYLAAITASRVTGRGIEPHVCLNMIVKDEASTIERALQSALPLIHTWAIVDTGSTDNTAERIEAFFREHGVPGKLYHRKWRNFGENRQEAVDLVHDEFPDATHVVFLDADDVFESPPTFSWPESLPQRQSFSGRVRYGELIYQRLLMVRNNGKCEWRGVIHEALNCPQEPSEGESSLLERLGVGIRVMGGGARSQNPDKFAEDAELLEEERAKHPEDARTVFYLAQSYRDAKQPQKALETYLKRIDMGGWPQEVYRAYIEAAQLGADLGLPLTEVTRLYTAAYALLPVRLEALHGLARYLRFQNQFKECFMAAQLGKTVLEAYSAVINGPVRIADISTLPSLRNSLFLEPWVYSYGLMDEFAICAYYTHHVEESLAANDGLLRNPDLPLNYVERIKTNRGFALAAMGRSA